VILAAAIRKFNPNTYFLKKLEDIVRFIVLKAKKGDIVLTLGAGDIYKWGKIIMEDMRESD
jgi:UDP-N-acetylmuramate--alanine ligase